MRNKIKIAQIRKTSSEGVCRKGKEKLLSPKGFNKVWKHRSFMWSSLSLIQAKSLIDARRLFSAFAPCRECLRERVENWNMEQLQPNLLLLHQAPDSANSHTLIRPNVIVERLCHNDKQAKSKGSGCMWWHCTTEACVSAEWFRVCLIAYSKWSSSWSFWSLKTFLISVEASFRQPFITGAAVGYRCMIRTGNALRWGSRINHGSITELRRSGRGFPRKAGRELSLKGSASSGWTQGGIMHGKD